MTPEARGGSRVKSCSSAFHLGRKTQELKPMFASFPRSIYKELDSRSNQNLNQCQKAMLVLQAVGLSAMPQHNLQIFLVKSNYSYTELWVEKNMGVA